jgi:hypothetical protein
MEPVPQDPWSLSLGFVPEPFRRLSITDLLLVGGGEVGMGSEDGVGMGHETRETAGTGLGQGWESCICRGNYP